MKKRKNKVETITRICEDHKQSCIYCPKCLFDLRIKTEQETAKRIFADIEKSCEQHSKHKAYTNECSSCEIRIFEYDKLKKKYGVEK